MSASKIMMFMCFAFVIIGTIGLIKDICIKARQRKQEKHYTAFNKNADNE